MAENKDQEFLTYKGRPLVRSGKTLYYGSMSDEKVFYRHGKSKGERF